MSDMKTLADQIKAEFGDAVTDIKEFRGDITVVVDRKKIVEVATYCRDTEGFEFNLLSDLAGLDHLPETPRFGVSYILYSLPNNSTLRLKAYVPEEDPVIPTVSGVWPNANYHEREVYDMFGITFEGHPDMRRILMPYDWTGHPLRKDYPLGYEEVEFSFNFDRVQAQKPAPKD